MNECWELAGLQFGWSSKVSAHERKLGVGWASVWMIHLMSESREFDSHLRRI